jgi:hypothetical protein
MTQDPYGQPQGSGYVVRGEVAPDDEANVTPPTVPMTRFQKVASALRGERTDPAVPSGSDPNGTWPAEDQPAATTIPNAPAPSEDASWEDARSEDARSEDVGAVRSPDDGNRDSWDGEDETRPEDAASPAAAASPASPAAAASPAAPVAAGEPAADAGADAATQDPTMTQPDLYGTAARGETDAAAAGAAGMAGAVEPETVGKHAGAPVQEGLRPGETDGGLGDFSDLTFSSLLPDAAEFKTRWQQVQFRFVDDPAGSVTEAADVIAQVTAKLEAAIQERQRAISERQRVLRDRWNEGQNTDTESLRETLLMYRAFLDQLTGPKMS